MSTVIGIFSPKGGVGKTLLATNLAVAFGLGHHRKTILIDLNKGNGSADLLLDLEPERSWSDLMSVINEVTPNQINLAVTEYRPGLDVLASPPKIDAPEILAEESLSLLLDALKIEYDLIVMDTPSGNKIAAMGILALSDIQLFVLTPDMPSLRSSSRLLASTGNKDLRIGLVINQYSPEAAINPEQIKEHLEQPLFGVLPIDPSGAWTNISYGEPCVLRKSSKLGKSIRQLSAQLLSMIREEDNQEIRGD